MKLMVVKDSLGALRAADDAATQALKGIAAGEYLKIDLTRPRNPQFHRLFFALLTVVFENLPEDLEHKYPTVKRLLWEVKLQMGFFEMHETLGGKMVPIPGSISFAKMDDVEFETFFQTAIGICRKYFLPAVSESGLRESIDAELSRYG